MSDQDFQCLPYHFEHCRIYQQRAKPLIRGCRHAGTFEYSTCPKHSNTLFSTFFGLNFAFYAFVPYNT